MNFKDFYMWKLNTTILIVAIHQRFYQSKRNYFYLFVNDGTYGTKYSRMDQVKFVRDSL